MCWRRCADACFSGNLVQAVRHAGLPSRPGRFPAFDHIGGVTADAYVKMGVAAARNALAVLNG
jgi:hypothetical protein